MGIKMLNEQANSIELEKKMQDFLSKGGSVASDKKTKENGEEVKMLSIPLNKSIVNEIDKLLQQNRYKMPRTLWIRQAIIKALEENKI